MNVFGGRIKCDCCVKLCWPANSVVQKWSFSNIQFMLNWFIDNEFLLLVRSPVIDIYKSECVFHISEQESLCSCASQTVFVCLVNTILCMYLVINLHLQQHLLLVFDFVFLFRAFICYFERQFYWAPPIDAPMLSLKTISSRGSHINSIRVIDFNGLMNNIHSARRIIIFFLRKFKQIILLFDSVFIIIYYPLWCEKSQKKKEIWIIHANHIKLFQFYI